MAQQAQAGVYAEIPPPPALRHFVQRYLYADLDQPVDAEVTPFPTGRCYFGFVFRAEVWSKRNDVLSRPASGLHLCGQVGRGSFTACYRGRLGHMLAELHPTAMTALFGIPASEVGGLTIDAADALPAPFVRRTIDLLSSAPDRASRVARFSRLLLDLANHSDRRTPDLDRAVALIDARGGQVSVSRLAERLEMSPRNLNRRFRLHVGLSPKEYAGAVRMSAAMSLLTSAGAASTAADIAASCGYFDEAHMSREFAARLGAPPRRYAAGSQPISRGFARMSPSAEGSGEPGAFLN